MRRHQFGHDRRNAGFGAVPPGDHAERSTAAGQVDVTLGRVTFSNKGLQGAGRFSANTRDFRNETLGSFSGMAIDLSTWRRNADGTYSGGIFTLPDRGPFDGAIDYRNRVHTSDIHFTPLRTAGAINFNSTNPGQTGRRNNQGLEAMTITPDNKKRVTILQSATVQDTDGAQQQTRNNTRILVYDISSNATPTNPIGHYVLQLPILNNNGSGAAPDRTAAQSELALNDTQFLVLARDSLGRGVAANASTSTTPVFKSILLVDTSGATNLAGMATFDAPRLHYFDETLKDFHSLTDTATFKEPYVKARSIMGAL